MVTNLIINNKSATDIPKSLMAVRLQNLLRRSKFALLILALRELKYRHIFFCSLLGAFSSSLPCISLAHSIIFFSLIIFIDCTVFISSDRCGHPDLPPAEDILGKDLVVDGDIRYGYCDDKHGHGTREYNIMDVILKLVYFVSFIYFYDRTLAFMNLHF